MMVRGSRRQRVQKRRPASRHRRLHLEQLEKRWVLTEVLPGFSKAFSPDTIGPGSTTTLTFTIDNSDHSNPEVMLAFTDVLPGGVTIATPAAASTDCTEAVLTAPDGGSTITFSDGKVGAFSSCTVSVNVTAASPGEGPYRNVSGDLTSAAGNSGPATAHLTVDSSLPGFTKSFTPSSVPMGDRSTLTFTIDNTGNGSEVANLDFTDLLPAGMVIAAPPNASTDCVSAGQPDTTLTAAAGTSIITLDADGTTVGNGFEVLPPGATCTASVDVIATGVGKLENVSSDLLADFVSTGKASDTLESTITPIALEKDFVNDPVPPGGTVTVDFTVMNRDRSDSATDIAFTDDLAAAVAGLTFSSLLANDCGGSVTGVGTTDLIFSGGTLGAGGTCTISASLDVPAGATPGVYTNTTGAITGTLGGSQVAGNMASDKLFVQPVPVFTKEFLDAETLASDPVINAGDDVVIRFTIANTSTTSGASAISFIDELTNGGPSTGFLPFPVSVELPTSACGGSVALISVGTDRQGLSLTGGSLAAAPGTGASCTFDVTVTTPPDLAPGIHTNTTEEITANVDDEQVIGDPASDTLTVIAAPSLSKSFTDDPVAPGGTATLEFTLTYPEEASGDATSISFTDDLAPVLAGLTATGLPLTAACDPDGPGGTPGTGTLSGSAGDTLLTFMGGTLSPGESCSVSVTLDVPAGAAPGRYTNTTSSVSATVGGLAATSAPASDDLSVQGLTFTKEFVDDPVIAGETTTLRFTIENVHPTDDATITLFSDNLSAVLPGLTATGGATVNVCGGTLSGTSSLLYAGGTVLSGQSCSIEVPVLVPASAADGTYVNVTSSLATNQGTVDPATDNLTVDSSRLQLTKTFIDDPVNPGDTVTLDLKLTNLDTARAASAIDFTDDLGAALSGLTFDSLLANDCGATVSGVSTTMITVDDASLAAGGSCTVRASLSVPGGAAPNVYTNTTSGVTGTIGGFAVTGDAASDLLEVVELLAFSKSFDGPTTATGTAVLTFTITNPTANTATGLAFSDDLDAVVSGLVATNLPLSDVCGAGSSLSGTSFVTLTGAELPPMGGTCSFDVEVLVPATATAGTFTNTTSALSQSGLFAADPATADLVIEPPPTFAKVFAPDSIEAGEVSRLTFTIDNSASAVAVSGFSFTDDFPAGVVIADPTGASSTCAGMGDASAGASSFTFGGSVGAGASCTVQLDVTSSVAGMYANTTGDLTSSSGNSGAASDTLTVTAPPPPTFSKSFDGLTTATGTPTLTFTITNPAAVLPATDLSFTDDLDAVISGLRATNTTLSDVCGSGSSLTGTSLLTLTGGSVEPMSSCTFDVELLVPVTATAGTFTNTTSDLLQDGTAVADPATADLTVEPAPTFGKVFAPDIIQVDGTSTLTFSVDNSASALAASSLNFTDNLPAGVVVSTPPNTANTCGGTLTADAGTGVVTHAGGTVAAGGTCSISVDVTSGATGALVNTTGDLASSSGNSGSASDTLTVDALTFDKVFVPSVIGVGSVSTLTFQISNPNDETADDLSFTDNLPAGVTIADPANATSSCGGTVSAPDGGSTITFNDGGVGSSEACSVTVDVTSSTVGTHTNVSRSLASSAGSTSGATADLEVDVLLPGFTKSFSPSSVSLGGRSTITLTIDNTGSEDAATDLTFVDNLPSGMAIADPSDAASTCTGGTLTATPGTSVISYGPNFSGDASVGALASCTVTVDVIGAAVGELDNITSVLTSGAPETPSGRASATLEVAGSPLTLTKSFTDDPVPPGGTVTVEFSISNRSRDDSADNISFTDDLDATLSGLAAVGLPLNDVCGVGSTLTGTSLLTLTGGRLASGASCTFSASLQVPTGATGTFTNTTSSIMGDIGGESVTGPPASDDLFVQAVPTLTKEFTDDPVGGGDTVTLSFNIENSSTTSAATDIAFTDNLSAIGPVLTPTSFPPAGFCGPGSSLGTFEDGGQLFLSLTDGSLAASGSCSFDVTMLVAPGSLGGTFTNTTSDITATVDGETAIGDPATDDVVVVGAPSLTKVFTDDPVLPGGTANLEFTITYGNEGTVGDATSIAFTDDLTAALDGLTAVGLPASNVCGPGSVLGGTTNLSLTGGTLSPGASCTFSVPAQVPSMALPGSYTNTTSAITATVLDVETEGAAAQDDLKIAGLTLTKDFTDDPVVPGGTVTLEFTLTNVSPDSDTTGIQFTDDLDDTLSGLTAITLPPADPCGAGSSLVGTSVLTFSGGSVAAGTSCTFSATLQVPAVAASDAYKNTTSVVSADINDTPVAVDPAVDQLVVSSGLLLFSKEFAEESASPGDTVDLDFTITNLDASQSATDITFTDDLDAALAGLEAVGLPASNVCGAGSTLSGTSLLTLTGGNLGPSGTCTFTATLQIPTGLPLGSSVNNITSDVTGTIGGLDVTGDPANDTLQIDFLDFTKTFDSPAGAGGATSVTFTIENLSTTSSASDLAFSDDLDAVIPGLEATGLPTNDVCGPGSQLAVTSLLTMTDGNLSPGGSCSFTVDLAVPPSASPGVYLNTTSDLSIAGIAAASPASDSLEILPPPEFSKAFAPDMVPVGSNSTLVFTIDNSANPLAASSLDFTDNLPAGVVVAESPNASTTCAGGSLTAVAEGSVITYSGGMVSAGSLCSVQVDVTPTTSALHVNTSGDLTSSLGNSGTANGTLDSRIMLSGDPLTPGLNLLTVSNGISDGIVLVVQGTQAGNQTLTVQGVQITTAFADPVPIGFAEVAEDGTATVPLFISASQIGQTLQFQAFQLLPIQSTSPVVMLPVVTAPLLVEGGEGPGAAAVSANVLPALIDVAIDRWTATGISAADVETMRTAEIQLVDLPVGVVGSTQNGAIYIDFTAAGHGWFVDQSPADNSEFGIFVAETEFAAEAGSAAVGSVDLLTVIMHELGHLLGFEDLPPGEANHQIMASLLAEGTRRLPTIWQNPTHILDVNDDGSVSPIDALIIINEVNASQFRDLDGRLPSPVPQLDARWFFDTNGDGFATPVDVLRVINHLNGDDGLVEAEGEAPPYVVDLALRGLQTEPLRVTPPELRQTVSVDNANGDVVWVAEQSDSSSANGRDFQVAASEAAETDLALMEWLEQQSSGNR